MGEAEARPGDASRRYTAPACATKSVDDLPPPVRYMPRMTTLHGIPNCTTVRKARAWLDEAGVSYCFHDFKTAGVDAEALDRWIAALGWEVLVNRAGTTFRGLPEAERSGLSADTARTLMLAHPSVIKRPVLEHDGTIHVGFAPERYGALFG